MSSPNFDHFVLPECLYELMNKHSSNRPLEPSYGACDVTDEHI